jgi:peptidyl-prolyl cis-trans isomerase B (cyclophilin B)
MHENSPHLDGSYAAFGKVIEGDETIDAIAGVPTNHSDKPKEDQRMKSVTVETFGVDYPEPKTQDK